MVERFLIYLRPRQQPFLHFTFDENDIKEVFESFRDRGTLAEPATVPTRIVSIFVLQHPPRPLALSGGQGSVSVAAAVVEVAEPGLRDVAAAFAFAPRTADGTLTLPLEGVGDLIVVALRSEDFVAEYRAKLDAALSDIVTATAATTTTITTPAATNAATTTASTGAITGATTAFGGGGTTGFGGGGGEECGESGGIVGMGKAGSVHGVGGVAGGVVTSWLCRLELIGLFEGGPDWNITPALLGAEDKNMHYILSACGNEVSINLRGIPMNNASVAERLHLSIESANKNHYETAVAMVEDLLDSVCKMFVNHCRVAGLPLPPEVGFTRHSYLVSPAGTTYLGPRQRKPRLAFRGGQEVGPHTGPPMQAPMQVPLGQRGGQVGAGHFEGPRGPSLGEGLIMR